MNRFLSIVCSLAGAVIFSLAIVAALWQNEVYLSTSQAIVFGAIAAGGFALMMRGYTLRRGLGLIVLDGLVVLFLVGFVYPNLRSTTSRSAQKRIMSDIRAIANAVEARATDFNVYPVAKTMDDLARQIEPTYIKRMPRKDDYGNLFRYEAWKEDPKSPGPDRYAVGSGGHDRKFEKSSLRQYTARATTNFDCDIVYSNGEFISYPGDPSDASWKPTPVAQQTSTDPKALFDEATALYRRDEFLRAIPLFQEFLQKNPDDALANARLGLSYCETSQYQEAIRYLQKAIALDPTDWQSHSNLGLVYEKLGKAEQGIEWARKALTLRPNDPGVINNLGWVLLQAHHNAEAVSAFEHAVRLAPGETLYRENLARARKASGRPPS